PLPNLGEVLRIEWVIRAPRESSAQKRKAHREGTEPEQPSLHALILPDPRPGVERGSFYGGQVDTCGSWAVRLVWLAQCLLHGSTNLAPNLGPFSRCAFRV